MKTQRRGRRPLRRSAPESPTALDRRQFLILVGGTAALMALRPAAPAWAKHVANLPPLQPWAVPDELPASSLEVARGLIGAAVLAPSDWNTQPWRFEVEDNLIRIVADPARALTVTDPDRRGMMVALGAALENMLIAARSWGLRPSVIYWPHEGANDVVAEVRWTNGDPRRDRTMCAAIPERRTNRRDFDERGLFPQNRAQLIAQVPEGLSLHWIDDGQRLRSLGDLVHDAVHQQVSNARAQAEQFSWMRFDDSARKRGDGVPVDQLELGGPAGWFAGRYFNPSSMFSRFGAEYAAKQARAQIRSSGSVVLLAAAGTDEATRLMGGQAFQRIGLKATELGIAHHVISAPIEVEKARPALMAAFGAGAEQPLLLMRLGHAKTPKPTPRRAVSLVATFRNT
jgi:nitroreductase